MNPESNKNTQECSESSGEINLLLEKLTELRKEAPAILYHRYVPKNEKMFRCLKQIKITLHDDGKCPDNDDETFAKAIKIPNDDTTLLPRVYEQTLLLNILTKMKLSSICRVIDDI